MYLSAERMAVANKAIQETFEQTSVAWQAIPHWDIGDPGQVWVRSDVVTTPERPDPFGGDSLDVMKECVRFYVTLAQACAPTPDALLAAVVPRTVDLAQRVDEYVFIALRNNATSFDGELTAPVYAQELLDALIDTRVKVEDVGYRAPSCLLTSKAALKALSHLVGGVPVTESLLSAANINSLHRVRALDEPQGPIVSHRGDDNGNDGGKTNDNDTNGGKANDNDTNGDDAETARIMLLLGRLQRIAHGGAAAASPGEEPVDLAVSVPPSLEVIGDTKQDYIELAVRMRYALRIKDERGVVAVDYTYPPTS
jgi:hypothetical protein